MWPRPISHAWMDEKDRTAMWTPINGYEWPVPIPKDVDLNLIRIEMLNLGLQYAWLDVLCLRQVGGRREDLRMEEWKVDVPTIGAVYRWEVVCYLSGLGRPLTLKEGDLDSDRSWFRRAWTLQEVGWNRVIAGDTPDGPLHAECKDGKYEADLLTRFHEQLESMYRTSQFITRAVYLFGACGTGGDAEAGVDEPSGQDRGTGISDELQEDTSIPRERVSRARMDSTRKFDGCILSGAAVLIVCRTGKYRQKMATIVGSGYEDASACLPR